MSEATGRFTLPFILPGQAQKEVFHNEALVRIDAALHAAVEGAAISIPPTAPADGQCWLVAPGASGAWSGKANQLAAWSEGGWRFLAPAPGLAVWDRANGLTLRWDGAAWSGGALVASQLTIGGLKIVGERQPHVPTPSGGTIIDAEARAAVASLIATLMSHGLID
jgi:hypothetical protein